MSETQARPAQRIRPKPRVVTVKSVEQLTPGCTRVVFTGPGLEGYEWTGPAAHIKVMPPPPGESHLKLPEWGEQGPILAEGESRPASRTYTPRRWEPESLELTVDFMLHGEGLASDWARRAKPGDTLAVSGRAGGAWSIDAESDWYLLGADESALPALATILEELPSGKQARVYIEVEDEGEQQSLESPAQIDVTWLHRGDQERGSLLEASFRDFTVPAGDGRVWVGCEAGVMRRIRSHLLTEKGMTKDRIHTQGYWKQGTENHPDHDVGQDE